MKTGQPAPHFALYDTEKTKVYSADYRGKNLLLLFFPFAFSSTCTAELCSVRDNIALYDKANATVFGISVDSVHTLKKFREEQGLSFTLLSDFNKEASIAYGAYYETFSLEMRGVSKRAAFIIDKDGVIRYAEVLENAKDVPDFKKIQTVLNDIA